MIPHTQPRKVKNSSKVNLMISFIFHAILVLVLFYFAAREGLLGKKLEKISVTLIKEKPPEKKPEPPKVEPPRVEPPKVVDVPKAVEPPKTSPPPQAAPIVAPPATEIAGFDPGGGRDVESGDPIQVYKSRIEYAFYSKWDRPEDMADENYVAEADVSVARDGSLSGVQWLKGSGNSKWDQTVKAALAAVTKISARPPTNFPPHVTIRFDVATEAEPGLQ